MPFGNGCEFNSISPAKQSYRVSIQCEFTISPFGAVTAKKFCTGLGAALSRRESGVYEAGGALAAEGAAALAGVADGQVFGRG